MNITTRGRKVLFYVFINIIDKAFLTLSCRLEIAKYVGLIRMINFNKILRYLIIILVQGIINVKLTIAILGSLQGHLINILLLKF